MLLDRTTATKLQSLMLTVQLQRVGIQAGTFVLFIHYVIRTFLNFLTLFFSRLRLSTVPEHKSQFLEYFADFVCTHKT